jgi:hypothetical protein
MTNGKVVPNHLTSNKQFFANSQVMVLGQKIPRHGTFELIATTITPHHMAI